MVKKVDRKKFVRYKEGAEIYSMGLTKFQELAKQAKVLIPMVSQRSSIALMTLFCVQSGSRIIIMKLQLLNRSVSRHFPFSRLPLTVSISTMSVSG